MFDFPLATIMTIVPLVGSVWAIGVNDKNTSGVKAITIWTTFFTLLLAIDNFSIFCLSTNHGYVEEIYARSQSLIRYRMSNDSISVLFALMTSFICFISTLWLFRRKLQKTKKYFASILLLESFSIGAFCASDMFLLYVFVEATIIPIYLMMSNRVNPAQDAIFQFLMYTIASAFLVLTAFILIYLETGTSNLERIYEIGIQNKATFWLLFTGIGIKMPIWPFYHWLPVVHVKSQTVCSIILASIVLKFATLLTLRFLAPLFTDMLSANKDLIICILIVSMLFAAAQLMYQADLKKIFAYFSIVHLNLYFITLLSGLEPKYYVFAAVYHSIEVAVLFFIAEIVKRVFNTRSIKTLRALPMINGIRKYIFCAFLILLSVPLSWGFVCEVIAIYSATKISIMYSLVISGIVLVSSTYAVFAYNSCFGFAAKKEEQQLALQDFYITDIYKKSVLYALLGIVLAVGLHPQLIFVLF
ncbi:MAG: hypothetical protein LBF56_03350 [Holosporales bacterium]|jgi:NADH-quinone oxidoreductase subunit M|nr:hypothetical protein [Holosporales bacterium]